MDIAPAQVNTALEALWEAGFTACPVGGCVRDGLLGKTPQDWDICTAARPEQTKAVFAGYRLIETGLKHGTVTVLIDGMPLEITTFRTEAGYADGRHPDAVAFVTDIHDDLSRRDFTVNAMAYDRDGSVIDPFGGRDDLATGRIRCVGRPEARFGEDALRILRAMRFASKLGFSVEPATAAAVHSQRGLLAKISPERIFSELGGILAGPGAGAVLREFSDVIFQIIPELAAGQGFDQHNPHHIHDVWTHTTMAVDAADPDPVLRLTMLLHDVGKPETFFTDGAGVGHFYGHAEAGARLADDILRRLRCGNATRKEVVELIRIHDTAPPQTTRGVRRLLVKVGRERFSRLIRCWRADTADRAPRIQAENTALFDETERLLLELLEREDCFSMKDLAVGGDDLLAMGMAPGPAVGRVLAQLFRSVTEDEVSNDRDLLLARARKILEK